MLIRLNSTFRRHAALLILAGALAGTAAVFPASAAVEPRALVAPVADYKIYVTEKVQKLVTDTRAFTDAVKAGDLAKAQRALPELDRAWRAYIAHPAVISYLGGQQLR